MKEFEVKVFAGYISGGEKYYNCFKEYVEAGSETEAKKILKAELKKDGYIDIKLSDVIAVQARLRNKQKIVLWNIG